MFKGKHNRNLYLYFVLEFSFFALPPFMQRGSLILSIAPISEHAAYRRSGDPSSGTVSRPALMYFK